MRVRWQLEEIEQWLEEIQLWFEGEVAAVSESEGARGLEDETVWYCR